VEAERFTPRGEVSRYRFPSMIVAEVAIRGGLDLELRALQWLYGFWLSRSGFVPTTSLPSRRGSVGRSPTAWSTSKSPLNCRSAGRDVPATGEKENYTDLSALICHRFVRMSGGP